MKNDSTLAHLRRLNPVPEAVPSVDGAELFDRITSLPQDERPAARRAPHRRRLALAAVALVVMALLATTAFAISGWFGDAVEPPVTKQEYRNAQDELTLPPGTTWPTLNLGSNSVTSPGAGGAIAVDIAMNTWECYWVDAIRSGDQAAQRRSHAELTGLLDDHVIIAPPGVSENWTPAGSHTFPIAVFADDGGVQFKRAMYADAAGGHPQNLIQSCRANGP